MSKTTRTELGEAVNREWISLC